MANLLNQNPIILTGIMASSYKALVAATLGTLFTLRIEKIYWRSPIVAGDQLLIVDPGSGNTLAHMRCENAQQSQVLDWNANPRLWRDFQVVQLDSGELEIYTR
jgi:hypothetical protein